jgi:hypothetical protein
MKKSEKYLKIIFCISFILILLASLIQNISPDDFVWHVKVGEWILENKTIPKTGIFSWLCENDNWFAHEWLSGVIMYICSFISLKKAAYIYLAITIICLGIIVVHSNKNYFYKNPIESLIWIILGFFMVSQFVTARPHWIAIILLLIYIKILEKIKINNFKYIWMIPFLIMFWSNIHGGSTNLIYLFPIGYILTGLFNIKIGRIKSSKMNKKQLLTYLLITLLSFPLICLNPRGIELLKYPYTYKEMTLVYIREWNPLSLSTGPIFLIVLISLLALLIFSKSKRIELSDIGIIGVFTILSFIYLRFSLWTYFVSSLFIFKYIDGLIVYKESKKDDTILFFNIFLTLMSIAIILGFVFIKYDMVKILDNDLIKIIKEDNPDKLYNDYNYGGILIYNDIEVFFDGRADMYSEKEVYEENMEVLIWNYEYEKKVNNLIEKYNFDGFLVDKNTPMDFVLSKNSSYEKLYDGEYVSYYKLN